MLAYERHGQGEPLVLLHGVGHRRQAWYPVLNLLTPHREVFLVDLPGHGESPALELRGRDIRQALSEELRVALVELGLERPHVGGNSLGGRIALEAAALGDVRSATALSPAGFWRSDLEFAYTLRLFKTVSAVAKRIEPQAPKLVKSVAGRTALLGWLVAHPGRMEPEATLGDVYAFRDAQPALREILAGAMEFNEKIADDVPVTIAWGSRDTVLPPRQATWAKKLLPQADHIKLRSCGHVPMSDAPRLVADVLLRGSAPVR